MPNPPNYHRTKKTHGPVKPQDQHLSLPRGSSLKLSKLHLFVKGDAVAPGGPTFGVALHKTRRVRYSAGQDQSQWLKLDQNFNPIDDGVNPVNGLKKHKLKWLPAQVAVAHHLEVPGLILYFADRNKVQNGVDQQGNPVFLNLPVGLLHIDIVAGTTVTATEAQYETIAGRLDKRLTQQAGANPKPWLRDAKWYMVAKYSPNLHHARKYQRLWHPKVVRTTLRYFKRKLLKNFGGDDD